MPTTGAISSPFVSPTSPPVAAKLVPQMAAFAPFAAWQPVHLLGRGRKTIVFQARPIHAAADAPADYVIKGLAPDFADDPIALAALKREARIASQLTHPNLPVLLAAQLNRWPPHLAFLYEPAVTARRLLQPEIAATDTRDETVHSARLKIPQALWIARQAAEALAALHAAGWLHGDVQPDNLLVSPQGRATLIDLGFARRLDGEESVGDEPFAGSYVYVSPEMIVPRGPLTPASDVYSLGVTLFELLTGRLPMETTNRGAVISWHLRQVAPDLRAVLPHAPLRLARLLRAMLAREPLRRPSMSELIDWLVELEIDTLAMR